MEIKLNRLLLAAVAALVAGLAAGDVAYAKSPTIRPDRDAICALYELAGHKDCPNHEIVRSSKSGKVLIPAILSGALSSVPVTPSSPVGIPVER